MIYVADTHILLWHFEDPGRLSRAQQRVWTELSADKPLRVSDMTLWEISTLFSLGRFELSVPLRTWFDNVLAAPLVDLVRITPAIASEVAALPNSFHRDPADRTIVATARVLGATLLTNDRLIIESGLVPTLS